MTETILKANYTTVRKQETSVSKHEDISIQSIKQVLHTDDPCLNIIFLSLILSATRKRNIFCLPFEIKKIIIIQMKNFFKHNPKRNAEKCCVNSYQLTQHCKNLGTGLQLLRSPNNYVFCSKTRSIKSHPLFSRIRF